MTWYWPDEPVGRAVDGVSRTVLVVVPPAAAETWLMDAVSLFAADGRVSTFFTMAADASPGTAEFLRVHGCPMLPWRVAARSEFDLVLANDTRGLAQLSGRPLLVPRAAGVLPTRLMCGGRVVPRMIALAHTAELAVVRNSCPEAAPMAAVVGDLCYDRLLASIPFRADYRGAFGLSRSQKLVVVTLSGGEKRVLDRRFALLDRLRETLPPDRYRVVAQPQEGWRSVLVAADAVIGDFGITTRYSAAIGLPVVIAEPPADGPRPDDAAELLRHAPRLRPDRPLSEQLRATMAADRPWQDEVAGRITSMTGYAADNLRKAIYRLLDLPEPTWPVPCSPVPLPHLSRDEPARPGTYT